GCAGYSGLGGKASQAAIEPLGLVPAEDGSDRLMFEDDRERFARFKPPAKPQYVLVSSLDAMHVHRRDVVSLVDSRDRSGEVLGDKGSKPLGGLSDLPNHAILDRGRLVGLWEYDTETQTIAWCSFGLKDKSLDTAVR